jgi:LacI family repressor for deo operon, udp, cdd, tsx, nupC, and nupG
MRQQSTTMRDVAQHAGVSVQTVSHVVNGTGNISDETRQRVLRTIEELNYRRNPIARSMRTRQTRMIALIILNISNPVLSLIASTIEAAAYAQGYHVLLYNTGLDMARERDYLNEIGDRRADGVIIVNTMDRASTARLVEQNVPAVLIDCAQPNSPLPTVSVDNLQAAYAATEHLLTLGHRRIAHISGTPGVEIAHQREMAYLQAMEAHGMAYRRVVPSGSIQWGFRNGYNAMNELLRDAEPPTAVFAASDELAIGAYRALAEAGMRVPHDISIMGFDNIEASAYTTPPLTTVNQPFLQLGQEAFSLLMRMLDGEQANPSNVLLPAEIVIRESTGAPP